MRENALLFSMVFIELAAKYQNARKLPAYESHIEIDWSRRRRATLRQGKKEDKKKLTGIRRLHCSNGSPKRNDNNLDGLNWEAVRVAFTENVAQAINGRGMHDKLAMRIQGFLDRLVRDHENVDLEWLKIVPPHEVKEFLMNIEGLGLKSVECIRLLGPQQPAFPCRYKCFSSGSPSCKACPMRGE